MLAVFTCLVVLFLLLLVAEILAEKHVLKGEYHRKFFHISAGSFIACWPWLMSWQSIQILALLMILFIIANRNVPIFNYHGWIGRATYGDSFLALAILVSALITTNKIFFAIAILQVALADGLAAVAGIKYGKNWDYKVFGQKKTVIGSMVFWIVSAGIFGVGLLAAHSYISIRDYYFLLVLMPPLLTLIENLAVYGIDNLTIPVLTIFILKLVQA